MFGMDGGGGDTQFTYKRIVWALLIISVLPLILSFMMTPEADDDSWADEYESISKQYYESAGVPASAGTELWTLTGIYTPYTSGEYGYTDDGWLYGEKVNNYTPSQYAGWDGDVFTVRQASNGIWYYTSAPTNSPSIVAATTDGNGNITSTDGASVYSAVTMDISHTSDTFFTSSSRAEIDGHYYYGYTGWRYAFQPLHSYTTTNGDGTTYDVTSSSTSLSLIFYQYVNLSGLAGQLSISGSDSGLSYLSASDIVKAYEGINFTATFDMTFSSIPMHLQIRLNPSAIAAGMSVEDCWNGGYWSVMVYGDRDVEDYVGGTFGGTDDFSLENMFNIFTDLFSFRIADHYDVEGWIGVVVSLTFSLAFYAVLIAVAVANPYMWFVIAIVGILQAAMSLGSGWWPF